MTKKELTTKQLAATLPTVLDLVRDESGEYVETQVPVPWFVDEHGNLAVTTEREVITGDYWGEFNQGYPYIVEALEEWAKENGGYWEWYNPAYFTFHRG